MKMTNYKTEPKDEPGRMGVKSIWQEFDERTERENITRDVSPDYEPMLKQSKRISDKTKSCENHA